MGKKRIAKKNSNVKTCLNKNVISEPLGNTIHMEAMAAALTPINPPVLLKICRLCGSKDGPFLNIFDADRVTAKRIEDIMPFGIAENDDLPHKICFRCSAKLEELYEFIQKCTKTQETLRKDLGKDGSLIIRPKSRTIWEEKLNKSNISNDDICDALIKKAMAGIKDIPFQVHEPERVEELNVFNKEVKINKVERDIPAVICKDGVNENSKTSQSYPKDSYKENILIIDEDDLPLKRETELSKMLNSEISYITKSCHRQTIDKQTEKYNDNNDLEKLDENNCPAESKIQTEVMKNLNTDDDISEISQTNASKENTTSKQQLRFDIMDHVSMIKVNGVGVLFQCKLCNRNFLKKEVVMSHSCAKNAEFRGNAIKDPLPQEPPKMPVVKYITTKPESVLKKPILLDDSPITVDGDDDEDDKPLITKKIKPRIGPASKVKKLSPVPSEIPQPTPLQPNLLTQTLQSVQLPQPYQQNNPTACNSLEINTMTTLPAPVIQIPSMSNLNNYYKLVAGPNNTFSLVDETGLQDPIPSHSSIQAVVPSPNVEYAKHKVIGQIKIGSKRLVPSNSTSTTDIVKPPSEISICPPYPVGLFQTLPHNSSSVDVPATPTQSLQTCAIKKLSYTVVQTGNPSKLLISTKQQPPVEEVPKKKSKKGRHEITASKQPFSVTLEDAAPTSDDSSFFTVINVDPLLEPSYVLPTDILIQESQISTSTNVVKQVVKRASPNDLKYTCNMCNEKFTREMKLLSHIQLHYNKLDEEDKLRFASKDKKETIKLRVRNRPKNGNGGCGATASPRCSIVY